MIRLMSCSMSSTATPNSRRSWSMSDCRSRFSCGFRPAAGSSSMSRRGGDHAARDLQASLVAVGQVAGLAVGELAQAHEVQPLRRARQRIGFRLAIGLELEQARQQARLDLGVLGDQQVFQHGQL